MATKLIEECLKVPALRRDFRIEEAEIDPKARERRERDELRSNTLRAENERQRAGRHERGDLAQRGELERSIASLKREIKLETKTIEMRKLLIKRIKQSSMRETPLSRAALSERDQLALEVIALHSQLAEVEQEEDIIKESQSRVIRANDSLENEEHERKRLRIDNEQIISMKRERTALKQLFFALIMESGVDWQRDDVLSEIVWSNK